MAPPILVLITLTSGRCDVAYCEGFRMPAHDGGATYTGAGVRKPPREETALGRTVAAPRVLWGFKHGGEQGP